MKLADEVNKLLEASKLNLIEVSVIAKRLGIDVDRIRSKHYDNMRDELDSQIDRAIPTRSRKNLREVLEYLKSVRDSRPRSRGE